MRVVPIVAGSAGLSLFVVGSAWAQAQFNVILNQGQTVGGDAVNLGNADYLQVVAGTGGQVGVLGADNDQNQLVLYYDGSNWSTVAASQSSVAGDSVQQFANLAISGNTAGGSGTRLTFLGLNTNNSDGGVFQYDAGSSVQEVAFDGKNGLTIPISYGSAEGFMPITVDQAGNVAFEPFNSSGNLQVVGGNSTSSPVQTVEYTSPNNESASSAGSSSLYNGFPLGISTDATGSTTFGEVLSPADDNNSGTIDTFSGGTATNISGSELSGLLLMAAQQNTSAAVNAALYEAQDPTNSNDENIYLYNNGSNHLLQQYTFADVSGGQDTAEMTTSGKIAYYVPSSTGGALEYYNLSSGTYAPTQIASVGSTIADPFAGGDFVIKSLPYVLQSPMINNNGLVVFDATIGISGNSGSNFQALLDWTGSGNATVLLYAGENIAGYGAIDPGGIYINGLFNQADVFKNSLNDQGYLDVIASFDDGNSLELLQTQLVPEPTAIALLPLAGAALMRRRKRR
jgi:hypothetical protein